MHDLRRSSGEKFLKSIFLLFLMHGSVMLFVFFFGFSYLLLFKFLIYSSYELLPYAFILYSTLSLIYALTFKPTFKPQNSEKEKKQTTVFIVLGFLNYFVCWFYGHANTLATRFAGDPWFELLTCSYTS